MRTGLLAAALLFAATGSAPAADPPLPPIVFQTQPPGQFLDQLRGAANIVGGEKGVKTVNKGLKEIFGEKGLDGIDINRPIVGYVVLAPKPKDITAVVAFPVNEEKDFLAFCDRVNSEKVRVDPKDKTLFHLPPLDRRYQALLRFSEGYAYIVYGANPAPHADPKALVPMAQLYDPADRGLVSGRIHFDRIPAGVKLASGTLMEEVKKTILGAFPLDRPDGEWFVKAISPDIEKLVFRYLLLAGGADTLTARVYIDPQTESFVAEAVLTPKPNSELSKIVAAYKTAPNRFASLSKHPDTVAAIHTRAPLFAPEIRGAVASALEAGGKKAVESSKPLDKAWTDELFKGLARTAKNKDADISVSLRGPDKDGWFTVIGAAVFDDPAALEKEAKISFQKDATPENQARMKWDADKEGKVAIHTFHFPTGGFLDFTQIMGGEKCYGAFAFAPDGVIGAVGPDPIPAIKEVLAAKPVPSAEFEMVANPARVVKAFEKGQGPNGRQAVWIADLIGKEDKLLPTMKITVEGGAELKATFTMNLKQLPRLMFDDTIDRANREPGVKGFGDPEPASPPPPAVNPAPRPNK